MYKGYRSRTVCWVLNWMPRVKAFEGLEQFNRAPLTQDIVQDGLVSEIANPHDRFFKEIFSHREIAIDFLGHYLPGQVFSCFDVSTIHLRKDSFVDKNLGAYFSDLLYQANLKDGTDAYVYLLFEHKSYPERLIAFHLLRYMIMIWEQALKEGISGNLPLVMGAFPICKNTISLNFTKYLCPILP